MANFHGIILLFDKLLHCLQSCIIFSFQWRCCGFDSYQDYELNNLFKCSAQGERACGVPPSCCVTIEVGKHHALSSYIWSHSCWLAVWSLTSLCIFWLGEKTCVHFSLLSILPSWLGLLNTPTAFRHRGKILPQQVSWIWH